ncbi:MAG: hypothetical protein ACREIR_14275, partial [Geminicoccaceae bacterium]
MSTSAPRTIGAATGIGRRPGRLGVVLILLGVIGHGPAPAAAQAVPGVPGVSSEPTTAAAPAPAEPDNLRAELEELLQRLEDPERTRELAETVRSLLSALDAEGAAGAAVAEAETSKVDEALSRAKPAAAELLARIEEDLRSRVATVGQVARQVVEAARTVPGLLAWTRRLLDQPAERAAFARAGGHIVTILGVGLLAMWATARALTPARRALVFRERDRLLSRWIIAVLLILLRIVPILVFAIAVNGLILIVQPAPVTRVWLSAGVSAIVIVRLGLVLAQAVLSP